MAARHLSSVLPGALHAENKGAIDWRGGLVAYGVQCVVVVVEPDAARLVQTLEGHTARVCLVRWAPRPPVLCAAGCQPAPLLASADATGRVVLWDSLQGEPLAVLSELKGAPPPKPLLSMHWLPPQRPQSLASSALPGVERGDAPPPPAQLLCVLEPGDFCAYQLDTGLLPPDAPSGERAAAARASVLWTQRLAISGGGRGTAAADAVVAVAVDGADAGHLAIHFGRGMVTQLSHVGPQVGDLSAQARRSAFLVERLLPAATGSTSGAAARSRFAQPPRSRPQRGRRRYCSTPLLRSAAPADAVARYSYPRAMTLCALLFQAGRAAAALLDPRVSSALPATPARDPALRPRHRAGAGRNRCNRCNRYSRARSCSATSPSGRCGP